MTASDCYVAPALHHHHEQTQMLCNGQCLSCWSISALLCPGSPHINLPFYGPDEIGHCFCYVYPLLKLACIDTYGVGILVVANAGMMGLVIFVVMTLSYIFTLYTIKAYPSETWYEALSTCSSHITVVVLFFVPILFIYIRPATMFPEDKMFSSTPSLLPCSTLWFTLSEIQR